MTPRRQYLLTALLLAASAFFPSAFAANGETTIMAKGNKTVFNFTMQSWFFDDTTAPGDVQTNFRLRRAELKLSGALTDESRWFVMADAAKATPNTTTTTITTPSGTAAVAGVNTAADNKILQDLGFVYAFTRELEFTIGQFKTQGPAESLDAIAVLWFPERSLYARTFGDNREPGALVAYKLPQLRVATMISNGGNANNDDPARNAKDFSVRADYSISDFIKVGAFTRGRNFGYRALNLTGANAAFTYADLTLRAEYGKGHIGNSKKYGWVTDAAYNLTSNWQPAVRYELVHDPNNTGNYDATAASACMSYLISNHNAKVRGSYTYMDNIIGASGSYLGSNGKKGSLWTLDFQIAI